MLFDILSTEKNAEILNDFLQRGKPEFYYALKNFLPSLPEPQVFSHLSIKQSTDILVNAINNQKNIDKEVFKDSIKKYQSEVTLAIYEDIANILSSLFKCELNSIIKVYLAYIPISPRYTSSCSIITFPKQKYFTEMFLHELVHFFTYRKLANRYGAIDDSYLSEFWILEETIIEPVLKNKKIQKYLRLPMGSYPAFYAIKIKKVPLMEKVNHLYLKSKNMSVFLDSVLEIIRENYKDILNQYRKYEYLNNN